MLCATSLYPQKKKTGRRENNLFDETKDIRDVLQKNSPIALQQQGLSNDAV